MQLGVVAQAVGMFAATNLDEVLLLALFFGRARDRGATARVVVGQYLGFGVILAVSVLGALGATLLPEPSRPYLGLVPLALGVAAAWRAWRERRHGEPDATGGGPGVLAVAAVTLATGGDNIGVYVPVFATAGAAGLVTFTLVFLVLVGALCAVGWFLATRPSLAGALSRWGDVLLPAVLIGVGLVILVEGGAFGR